MKIINKLLDTACDYFIAVFVFLLFQKLLNHSDEGAPTIQWFNEHLSVYAIAFAVCFVLRIICIMRSDD